MLILKIGCDPLPALCVLQAAALALGLGFSRALSPRLASLPASVIRPPDKGT